MLISKEQVQMIIDEEPEQVSVIMPGTTNQLLFVFSVKTVDVDGDEVIEKVWELYGDSIEEALNDNGVSLKN